MQRTSTTFRNSGVRVQRHYQDDICFLITYINRDNRRRRSKDLLGRRYTTSGALESKTAVPPRTMDTLATDWQVASRSYRVVT
jgi:hypothetical protein